MYVTNSCNICENNTNLSDKFNQIDITRVNV